jgi:hypothetical protein
MADFLAEFKRIEDGMVAISGISGIFHLEMKTK